jgi:hypothetical protein
MASTTRSPTGRSLASSTRGVAEGGARPVPDAGGRAR